MATGLLVISNFKARRTRMGLTIAAILLSVSLVVAVTSGYASLHAAAQNFLDRYLGSTDATITRGSGNGKGMEESLIGRIQSDPLVASAVGRLEFESRITRLHDTQPAEAVGLADQIIGIDRPNDKSVEAMKLIKGQWFNTNEGRVVVIDQVAAEKLNVDVGGTIQFPTPAGPVAMTVVGIIHKPTLIATSQQTVYIPLHTLQELSLPGQPPLVSRIMVRLKNPEDSDKFADHWRKELGQLDPLLKLRLASDSRKEMDHNLQGVHVMSYLGGAVAMVSATFIVFSSLAMGVSERQRTLAMLRAIGAFRTQVAKLVVLEGVILAAVGSILGVPLGYLWVYLLSHYFSRAFTAGVVLSWGGVILGIAGSVLAALAASFLPAWNASRVSPLAAMNPQAKDGDTQSRIPWRWAVLGLFLMSLDPLLLYGPLPRLFEAWGTSDPLATTRSVRFFAHFIIGLPGVMLGAFLIAPLFVWLIERTLGPVICLLLGLRYALLRQQLTSGLWRSAGTSAALMVGLATLVAMQIQGATFLNGWRLPDRFPDVFIVSFFGSLSPSQQAKLTTAPGILPGQAMPIVLVTPKLSEDIFAVDGTAASSNTTLFVGVDPGMAFKMIGLDFLEGTEESAVAALKKGRALIVTDEFRQLRGLHVGDTIELQTTRHGTVPYTIAGVAWSPGIDLIVGMFDMSRQFEERTRATVFGSLEDAKEDFGVQDAYLFAANLQMGIEKDQLLKNLQSQLSKWGMMVGDVREIKYNIQQGFGRLLLLANSVAYAAMLVASLGVTNTIMASVRSRRWQFGILRSVGVTRMGLLRLILSEAILLGLVGVVLGLVVGLELAVNAQELAKNVFGLAPPISIPWGDLTIGAAIVMAIATLASLWPSIQAARTQPLTLLQAGRSSA